MKKHSSKRKHVNSSSSIELRTPSEEELERIEAEPEFQRMMKESEEDIRAGRVYTQDEVDELLAARSQRR